MWVVEFDAYAGVYFIALKWKLTPKTQENIKRKDITYFRCTHVPPTRLNDLDDTLELFPLVYFCVLNVQIDSRMHRISVNLTAKIPLGRKEFCANSITLPFNLFSLL